MGKKPVSILQREKQRSASSESGGRKRKSSYPEATAKRQHSSEPRRPASPGAKPVSATHLYAAAAVKRLLDADANQSSGISIKSLTLAPHIPAPAAVHAVTVETLKHMAVLQPLLERTQLVEQTPGLSHAVALVLVQDCLFGQGLRPTGRLEKAVLARKSELLQHVQRMLDAAGVDNVVELLPAPPPSSAASRPRSARVNTLKMSVAEALAWLRSPPASLPAKLADAGLRVEVDTLLPDLLLFPPGSDLHAHPLVKSGAVVLQSKASCMPAHALRPELGWQVVDACAAPGNKTTHLAALMRNQGTVLAYDKDPRRLQRLQHNAELAGAACVQPRLADFLAQDPRSAEHAGTRGVLLDPSCSGSGTGYSRGDHLLPSAAARPRGDAAIAYSDDRVEALAQFQEAALHHALSFPAATRVVYSTCSLHARENEEVVAAVLPSATKAGWRLDDPFPAWHRRGVEGLVAGAKLLIRTDPDEDNTDGFFIACFVRDSGSVVDSMGERLLTQQHREKNANVKKKGRRKARRSTADGATD